MSLAVSWLAAPIVLGLLCLGCGLALDRLAGTRMPGALLWPTGLAAVVVVAQATTASDVTAELTTPAVVAVALAGLVLGRHEARRALSPGLVAAVLVLLVYGAPVLASGSATFAGYIKLDDTATWLAFVDRFMEHGRNLHGLAPSTYEATLAFNLPGGYPLGAFVGLGVLHQLVGVDSAWIYQPFEAFAAAMLALSLYALTDGAVRSTRGRVAVATVAAQPATLFAYVQWGGIKEVMTAALLPLAAAHAVGLRDRDAPPRAVLPLAVCSAAVLAVLSVGAVVWVAPLVLPALLVAGRVDRRAPWRAVRWPRCGELLALTALCSIPVIVLAKTFLRPLFAGGPAGGGVFSNQTELGNLIHPLNTLQIVGIWPAGDFRIDPTHLTATRVLVIVAILAALSGVALAWRAGNRGVAVYAVGAVVAGLAIVTRGSPWVDGKSLAQASPAVILAALVAAAVLWQDGGLLRGLGIAIACAVGGGVLWSNALAYRDVNLAPRGQLRDLEHIGHLAAGQGPTLMTEYAVFGARHFLRQADAESASELRRRLIPLRSGRPLDKGAAADVDSFALGPLLEYRSIVLRRSPVGSRPPAPYRLVWSGAHYELWQRGPARPRVLEHLPLGDALHPGAQPRCAQVRRLARKAGPQGRLAWVPRLPTVPVILPVSALPHGWTAIPGPSQTIYPVGSGTVAGTVRLTRPGRFEAWLGGSVRGLATLSVDGRTVGSVRQDLNYAGAFTALGPVALSSGTHRVVIRYDAGGLRPGTGGQQVNPFGFGPVVLARQTADQPVHTAAASAAAARSLCGQRLDWVEALPAA